MAQHQAWFNFIALNILRPTMFGPDILEMFLSDHWNYGGASALTIQLCESSELALASYLMHEQRALRDNGVLKVMEHG